MSEECIRNEHGSLPETGSLQEEGSRSQEVRRPACFELRDLTFTYPEQPGPVLRNLTFSVGSGEFVTVCGPSGCGKTTLLRQLKSVLAPHGKQSGEIFFEGRPLQSLDLRTQSAGIGFVQQSPENQIVTDKVWHELSFGLESLGTDTETIRVRVAEMASFFGIQNWFYKNVSELSGGQKQLLSLAAVMTMEPRVLVLDEPTSQLDPIAASDFLAVLGKINREFGTAILITEHRLEEVMSYSDRVLVLDEGRLIADGTPQEAGEQLRREGHTMFLAMPAAMRVWAASGGESPCPVTVRDGRRWLEEFSRTHVLKPVPGTEASRSEAEAEDTCAELSAEASRAETSAEASCAGASAEASCAGASAEASCAEESAAAVLKNICFRYEEDGPDVIRNLSLRIGKGTFYALLGGNGTGKTTLLSILAGSRRPYRGEADINVRTGMLPQDPQTLFLGKTLREDLFGALPESPENRTRIERAIHLCRLEKLLDRHPYDLSGGEQQRAALCRVLLPKPQLLLLDEPTKGMDAEFKQALSQILKMLCRRGVTVFMVSHDVEFCAEYADRCALFFDGSVLAENAARAFFSGNSFYTTAANRMARGLLPDAVTVSDLILSTGGTVPAVPEMTDDFPPLPEPAEISADRKPKPLPLRRKAAAAVFGIISLILLVRILSASDLTKLTAGNGVTAMGADEVRLYAFFLLSLFLLTLCVMRRDTRPGYPAQPPAEKRKLSRRTAAASVLILALIPLTLYCGIVFFGGKKYYFIALLILLEMMLPFFMIFEGRKPKARELVIIAVLCALGVAGRAAFFALPEFKPVVAITILSGVALGGETGFLVGAMTMLLSNVMFGQGPWTPFQMFAMGIIGFLAGVLFRKGLLRRTRLMLCLFGAFSSIVIYGGIMNPVSALLWMRTIDPSVLLACYLSGFPVDCVRAAATWLFLWIGAEPMLEKLDRVKVKYGLEE